MPWPLSWRIGNRLESSAEFHQLSVATVIGSCRVGESGLEIGQMRYPWSDRLFSFENNDSLRISVTALPCSLLSLKPSPPCYKRRNLKYPR